MEFARVVRWPARDVDAMFDLCKNERRPHVKVMTARVVCVIAAAAVAGKVMQIHDTRASFLLRYCGRASGSELKMIVRVTLKC